MTSGTPQHHRHRHQLAIEVEGPDDAPRVILVHGTMDRMTGLAKVARRLSGAYQVTRYDRRGYGRSRPHAGPFTIADNVEDLVAVIGDGSTPVVLVGHSLGGNIVLAAADRLGPAVAGVVIYESPLSWTDWWPGTSAGSVVVQSQAPPEEMAEAFMARMIGRSRWERLPAATREARRAEGPALVGEITSLHAAAPWDPDRIRVPVVVGLGSDARPHHVQGMHLVAEWIGGAELVTLEGCGHLAHVAAPDRFTDELIRPLLARIGW